MKEQLKRYQKTKDAFTQGNFQYDIYSDLVCNPSYLGFLVSYFGIHSCIESFSGTLFCRFNPVPYHLNDFIDKDKINQKVINSGFVSVDKGGSEVYVFYTGNAELLSDLELSSATPEHLENKDDLISLWGFPFPPFLLTRELLFYVTRFNALWLIRTILEAQSDESILSAPNGLQRQLWKFKSWDKGRTLSLDCYDYEGDYCDDSNPVWSFNMWEKLPGSDNLLPGLSILLELDESFYNLIVDSFEPS